MLITPKPDRPERDSITDEMWLGITDNAVYRVIEIKDSHYRIQPDEDYPPYPTNRFPVLYPTHLFDIVDGSVEPGWIVEIYHDNGVAEISLRFAETSVRGFWEKVHDGNEEAIRTLSRVLQSMKQRE